MLDRTTTGRRGRGQLPATRRNGRFGYSLAAETHAFGLCLELVELPVQGDLSGELLLLPRVMAKEVLDFCSASSLVLPLLLVLVALVGVHLLPVLLLRQVLVVRVPFRRIRRSRNRGRGRLSLGEGQRGRAVRGERIGVEEEPTRGCRLAPRLATGRLDECWEGDCDGGVEEAAGLGIRRPRLVARRAGCPRMARLCRHLAREKGVVALTVHQLSMPS